MFGNRFISFLAIFVLFPIGAAWGEGEKSPEALAMAVANALRSGNAAAIVALHHFVPTQYMPINEQRAIARREWRVLIMRFQISGYRLSMLSAVERQQFLVSDYPDLVPVKKLIITLVARHGQEKQIANHYIGHIAGRYFIIEPNNR